MRIAVFSDSYKPYVSGVVNSVDTFCRELQKMGHQCFIFAPAYPGYTGDESGVFRFLSVPAPTNSDYRLAIPLSPAVCRRLRELRIDVVHTHSPFLMGGLGAGAARRLRLPLVFTYHTVYEEYVHYAPIGRGLAKRLMRRISRDYCNRCDTVIVPTQAIRDLLDRYGVESEVVVNPTGIDLSQYEGLDRSFLHLRHGIPPEHCILLFVGRLAKEKNVHFLIRSFARIVDEDSQVTLVLIGGGPERDDLERLARNLGVETKVVFAGSMQPSEMPTAYAGADIFVFTSTTDTQGMVISEAMAAGLPVVAVRAYGSGNVVDDGINGLLTSVDEKEFSDAVIGLLRDTSLLNRLTLGTRERAEQMSSIRCAERLEQVYLAAVKKKTRL